MIKRNNPFCCSLKDSNKHKRNCAIVGGVVSSLVVSPLLAGLAVSVGVPILLCYVYGIVPIALCRSDYSKADLDEITSGKRATDLPIVESVKSGKCKLYETQNCLRFMQIDLLNRRSGALDNTPNPTFF